MDVVGVLAIESSCHKPFFYFCLYPLEAVDQPFQHTSLWQIGVCAHSGLWRMHSLLSYFKSRMENEFVWKKNLQKARGSSWRTASAHLICMLLTSAPTNTPKLCFFSTKQSENLQKLTFWCFHPISRWDAIYDPTLFMMTGKVSR